MSIVRSLLIKIGFVTDKQAVNSANKAVDRFKLRFALIASAATYAFSKVTSFFNNIATKALDASDLSKKLNITLSEIIAIQRAAANFRLDDKEIAGSFSRLNQMLFGFRTKTNMELIFLKKGVGDFEIDANENVITLFQKFLVGLKNVAVESERIRLAEGIFGDGVGAKIAEIAKNLDKFNENVQSFIPDAKIIENTIEDIKNYTTAINELTIAWESFATQIGIKVFPVFTKLLNYFKNDLLPEINLVNKALYDLFFNYSFDKFKELGQRNLSLLKKDKDKFLDFIDNLKGKLQPVANYIENRNEDALDSYMYPKNSFAGVGVPVIEINNEFNLPPGTSQEAINFIAEGIESEIRTGVYQVFREIQYNNPQVE